MTKENNMCIHCISILTIGGKYLWEEHPSLDIDHDILETNDLFRKGPLISLSNDMTICEIDPKRTNINDFFMWNELPHEDDSTFCWKKYYYLSSDKKECWLQIPNHQRLSHMNVQTILDSILDYKDQEQEVI
jgi:hypothetical protein